MEMTNYANLPGVFATKLDGGIKILQGAPSNVTLVMGTAPDGPTDVVFLVKDTAEAQSIFDPNGTGEGTLLRGMYEAMNGGAPFVGLYRIGADSTYVDFVGPYKIESQYGGSKKLDNFKFFYYHPTNLLKIYDNATGTLVYSSDPNDPVNIGAVKVSLSHPGLSTSSGFTHFNDLNMTPMTYDELKTFMETNGIADSALSGTLTNGTNEIVVSGTLPDVVKEGAFIKLTGGNTTNTGTYEILSITENGSDYVLTVRPNDYTKERMLTDADLSFQFADNSGSDDTFSDGLIVGAFYDGNNGLSLSYEAKYEAFEKAYYNLESIDMDYAIPMDVYMDAPNVINNAGNFELPNVTDFLGAGSFENVGGAISFMWDNDNDGLAERLSIPYEVGLSGDKAKSFITNKNQLASTILAGGNDTTTFHEVNFAFQLGRYLHSLSENDNDAIGFIGVMPPSTMNTAGIHNWLGSSPAYDAATGDMVANGSGLLGNKFMVGTVTRTPGFFLTDNGYLDGTPQKDANGAKIDLGKYLNIVAHWVNMIDSMGNRPYITSGAALYGGFTASLPINVSPTNKDLPSVAGLAFKLHKRALDKLTAAHYVAFGANPATGGIKVIDAPTAATNESDWRRLLTVRIVGELLDSIRKAADPYIGNVFNGAVRGSLEQKINSLITERQKAGYVTAGSAVITQTRAQAIAGEADVHLTLYVVGELRRINVIVALRA